MMIAALLCEVDHVDDRDHSSDLAMRFEVLSVAWDDYPDDRQSTTKQLTAAARELLDQKPPFSGGLSNAPVHEPR